MRNRHAGICYRCGLEVKPGDGHFERHNGKWRTQHATCAIEYREKEQQQAKLLTAAKGET